MTSEKWVCVSKTDVGTARKVNEDSYLADSENAVWCVADGMGGHARGDLASQLIIEQLSKLIKASKLGPNLHEIEACIQVVNCSLQTLSKKQQSIVGSTVVILFIDGKKAHCIWAGDSRIYRLRNKQLVRLTRDHSQVEDMVDAGLLSAAEAEAHPKANIITRAVGAHDVLQLDIASYDIDINDKFILCSDGLNKVMPDNELQNFMQFKHHANLADELIEIALARKARDNVTVVIVENENFVEHELAETLPLDQTLPLGSMKS